jgi:hypothetical protein
MEALKMFKFIAFYRDKKIEVLASTSYEAQKLASVQLKARKSYDVTVFRADIAHTLTN